MCIDCETLDIPPVLFPADVEPPVVGPHAHLDCEATQITFESPLLSIRNVSSTLPVSKLVSIYSAQFSAPTCEDPVTDAPSRGCAKMTTFDRNQRVVLVGLKERHDLNGCEAKVIQEYQGRVAIWLTVSAECIRVKPENLIVADESQTASPQTIRDALAPAQQNGSPKVTLPPSAAETREPVGSALTTAAIQEIAWAVLLAFATLLGALFGTVEKKVSARVRAP
jgi:hypothetical protein